MSITVFEAKSADVVVGGIRLRVEGPRLHQHHALVALMKGLHFQPVLDALKPAIEAAQAGGGFVQALVADMPKVGTVLADVVGRESVGAVFEAAVIVLDTKVNRGRIVRAVVGRSNDTAGDDIDLPAGIADDEPTTGPGGEYLRCDALRTWLRDSLTMGDAWTVVTAAVALGGYADMGKALMGRLGAALRAVPAATPAAARPSAPPVTATDG